MELVSVDEIVANPTQWHGRSVAVVGVFKHELEDVSIAVNRGDPRKLWVDLSKDTISRDDIERANNGAVVIEGVIEIGRSGHFGMFPGQITHVMRLVRVEEWDEAEKQR